MKSNRWLLILIALIAGIGIGLAYGWVVDPVDFFDLTPDTLRADYKTDYVLMTAEAYRAEQDPALAAPRPADAHVLRDNGARDLQVGRRHPARSGDGDGRSTETCQRHRPQRVPGGARPEGPAAHHDAPARGHDVGVGLREA